MFFSLPRPHRVEEALCRYRRVRTISSADDLGCTSCSPVGSHLHFFRKNEILNWRSVLQYFGPGIITIFLYFAQILCSKQYSYERQLVCGPTSLEEHSLQAIFSHFLLRYDSISADCFNAFGFKNGFFVVHVFIFEAYVSFLCHKHTRVIDLQRVSMKLTYRRRQAAPSQTSISRGQD